MKKMFVFLLVGLFACSCNSSSEVNQVNHTGVAVKVGTSIVYAVRQNIDGVDCVIVNSYYPSSQNSPAVSCNWK